MRQEMPEKDRISGTSQTDMGRDRAPASCWQNFPAQPAEQDDQPAERKQRWFAIPRA